MEIDIVETAREWPVVSQRLAVETDERKRAMLTEFILHMVGEYIGDTPMVMDTLVDKPDYFYWGLAMGPAPADRAAVIASYDMSAKVRQNLVIDRILVDEDLIFTEGALLVAWGMSYIEKHLGSEFARTLDPEVQHVARIQMGIVWPYASGGKLLGESIYFGSRPEYARPIGPDEKLYNGPVYR